MNDPLDSTTPNVILARATEADKKVRSLITSIHQSYLALAEILEHMTENELFHALGYGGIYHYAEQRGIGPPARTLDLLRIGRNLPFLPETRTALLEGTVTLESAAAMCEVAQSNTEESWLTAARANTTATFRRIVRCQLVEQGLLPPTRRKTFEAREVDLSDFETAHAQVNRDLGAVVTEGEALGVISRDYLKASDLAHRRTAPEREGPGNSGTQTLPGQRYVPARVSRYVWARDRGCCRVPGCANRSWLDLSHIVARRDGGRPDESNLVLLCRAHNHMIETGDLSLAGDAESLTFYSANGEPLGPASVPKDQAPNLAEPDHLLSRLPHADPEGERPSDSS